MKKLVFILIIMSFLLSGCYLIPEEILTPVASLTPFTINKTQVPDSTSTLESDMTNTPLTDFTLTYTSTFTPTYTLTVTQTLAPTKTFTPTSTFTKTSTPTPYPYQLQSGSPVYIENFAHTDADCNWIGIAGQVFGEDGSPQINLVVVVKGKINEVNIDLAGVTGVPEADIYGPGGYEIVLADSVSVTNQSLTVQVFDLNSNPLSAPTTFDTYADCEKNLIIINFQPN